LPMVLIFSGIPIFSVKNHFMFKKSDIWISIHSTIKTSDVLNIQLLKHLWYDHQATRPSYHKESRTSMSPTKIWISPARAILFGWKTRNHGSGKSPYQWTTFQIGISGILIIRNFNFQNWNTGFWIILYRWGFIGWFILGWFI
jgi:hypothetical protein